MAKIGPEIEKIAGRAGPTWEMSGRPEDFGKQHRMRTLYKNLKVTTTHNRKNPYVVPYTKNSKLPTIEKTHRGMVLFTKSLTMTHNRGGKHTRDPLQKAPK